MLRDHAERYARESRRLVAVGHKVPWGTMVVRKVAWACRRVQRFVRVGRPWASAPDGWDERPGMHLGNNIWAIPYERTEETP